MENKPLHNEGTERITAMIWRIKHHLMVMLSLQADEVTEILSLCVRYVSMSPKIQILRNIHRLCSVRWNYWWTTCKCHPHRINVMEVQRQCPLKRSGSKVESEALYTNCNSHVLNLSIAASCNNLWEIWLTMWMK